MIAGSAFVHLLAGRPYYLNWWGGLLFAPIGLFIGVFLMIVALKRHD